MELESIMIKTFGRGVWIGWARVQFQSDGWTLQGWIWDRTKFKKRYYTNRLYNLAIF